MTSSRSVMITPINTYGPSLIRSLGYAGYTANGMQAPGAAIALVWSVGLAWNSDRVRERGLHIATAMSLACAGCLWLALAPDQVGRNVLYGGYLMAAGTMATGQGINAVSTHLEMLSCEIFAHRSPGSAVVLRSAVGLWHWSHMSCRFSWQGSPGQTYSSRGMRHVILKG